MRLRRTVASWSRPRHLLPGGCQLARLFRPTCHVLGDQGIAGVFSRLQRLCDDVEVCAGVDVFEHRLSSAGLLRRRAARDAKNHCDLAESHRNPIDGALLAKKPAPPCAPVCRLRPAERPRIKPMSDCRCRTANRSHRLHKLLQNRPDVWSCRLGPSAHVQRPSPQTPEFTKRPLGRWALKLSAASFRRCGWCHAFRCLRRAFCHLPKNCKHDC